MKRLMVFLLASLLSVGAIAGDWKKLVSVEFLLHQRQM